MCAALAITIFGFGLRHSIAEEPGNAPLVSSLRLPARFEPNLGQAPEGVKFIGTVAGRRMTFTVTDARLLVVKAPAQTGSVPSLDELGRPPAVATPPEVAEIRMVFEGARPDVHVSGVDELPGKAHYYVGPRENWRTDIPLFAKLRYFGLYSGVDAVFYDGGGGLEYDFVIEPNASPGPIVLRFDGILGLRIAEDGSLVLQTTAGDIQHRAPVAYQEEGGARRTVPAAYAVLDQRRVAFALGGYDQNLPLVIDPELSFVTYLGGSDFENPFYHGAGTDAAGNVYVSGQTRSLSFRGQPGFRTTWDAYVASVDPTGSQLRYVTFLGGTAGPQLVFTGDDEAHDIFVDAGGSAYVAGLTKSKNFPITVGPAFRASQAIEGFLVKLAPGGGIAYARLTGTTIGAIANAVAVDAEGNAYLGGFANNLPPFLSIPTSFVAKFDAGGAPVWATPVGTSEPVNVVDLALDAAGNIHVGAVQGAWFNPNVYVAKLAPDGASYLYERIFDAGRSEYTWAIAVDTDGSAFVAGETWPEANRDLSDAFLARFDPEGQIVSYNILGGSAYDAARDVAVTDAGAVYLGGTSLSPDFPRVNAFTPPGTFGVGAFVTKFNGATADIRWSTVFGGDRGTELAGLAWDGRGAVYFEGRANSTDLARGNVFQPVKAGATDAYIAKILDGPELAVVPSAACTGIAPLAAPADAPTCVPGTTRWKPQRDLDTPIEVVFRGPADLGTATLEVTPPAGFFGPYTPITDAFNPNARDAAGNYTLVWRGPWTYESGGVVRPMPAGNYRVVVRGTRAGNTSLPPSDPYDKISLVEVTALRLMTPAGARPLEANPGPGAGEAIFPEAREPGGAVEGLVQVIAMINPAVSDAPPSDPVQVFLQAYDVDDPSSVEKEIDDEGKPTDNRADTNAGLFTVAAPAATATPEASIGTPLPKGIDSGATEGMVTLRVSPRQGDNYRVAATTYQPWLSQLNAPRRTTDGALLHSGGEQLMEGRQITKMLTVWRTLHLEVDRLVSLDSAADQARMDVRGSFTKLKDKSLEDSTGPFKNHPAADVLRLNDWVLHTKDDDWLGGDLSLSFHAADIYDVSGNSKTLVSVALRSGQPNLLNGQQDANITDRAYTLRDDDIASLEEAADYSLAVDLLADVYIRLLPVQQTDEAATIAFVIDRQRAANRRNLVFDSLFRLPSELPQSMPYWSVQLVSGFDGLPEKDLDPQTETGLNLGFADYGLYTDLDGTLRGGKLKAVVFMETLRDLYAKPRSFTNLADRSVVLRRATAHELLHTLGVPHGERIMCANPMVQPEAVGGQLSDHHREILRSVSAPVKSKSVGQVCK